MVNSSVVNAAKSAGVRFSRRQRPAVAGVLLVAGSMLLAACGSSSSSTGSSGSNSASKSQAAALTKQLTAMEGYPAFTAPGPALDAKKLPKSTRIVVIDNSPSVGPLEESSAGAMAAAKAAGFSPKLLNGGADNTVSQDIDLLEEAVNLHPAVVLQVGIITALEAAGLQDAKSHGVPVIAINDNQPQAGAVGQGSGPLIAATASEDYSVAGTGIAKYVASKGPSNALIGAITSDDIVPSNIIFDSFKSELAKLCPKCRVISQNVDTADWTTQVTPTVTSMLDGNPSMNYLFPVVDGMAPWVSPALTAGTHPNLSVISVNATPGAAMQSLKSGQFAAEVGEAPQMIGWYSFDAALRVMLKLPAETDPNEPQTFFTTGLMNSRNLSPSSVASLFGDSYEAGFLKLWGLG